MKQFKLLDKTWFDLRSQYHNVLVKDARNEYWFRLVNPIWDYIKNITDRFRYEI